MAGVRALITADVAPYVDFGIWGPFGKRILRRIVFVSHMYNPLTGEWTKKELSGPPDFESWWTCWRLFKVVCLLLEVVYTEVLDNYGELIREMATTYGPDAWFIVYQADVRMRSEHWERLRRLLEDRHAKLQKAGVHSDYNPAKPWQSVIESCLGADASDFWNKNVHREAMLFKTRIKSARDITDAGSWQTEEAAAGQQSVGQGSSSSRAQKRPAPTADDSSPKKRRSNGRGEGWSDQSKKDDQGLYTHNRIGNEICKKYNQGNCTVQKPGAKNCPNGFKHQCNKCLGAHSAIDNACKGGGKGGKHK